MDKEKKISNLFLIVKDWFITLVKDFWNLKWDTKIGYLFLIPPTWGCIIFILNIVGIEIDFGYFPDDWKCIHRYSGFNTYEYAVTPVIPLYLGLMAIAGAYLIKGNINRK